MTLPVLPEQITHWPVDRLNPYARNAHIHFGDQGAKIAASPVSYGCTPSILDSGDGAIISGYGRITVERPDGAGFSAYLPAGRFTILLRKTGRRLDKSFKRRLRVCRQVLNTVINPSAADAGIAAACDACRTPGQRCAVEGEVIRRLGERGWAMLLICHDLSTGTSATVVAHDVPCPGSAPVAVMC